jgi:hypothetical protein
MTLWGGYIHLLHLFLGYSVGWFLCADHIRFLPNVLFVVVSSHTWLALLSCYLIGVILLLYSLLGLVPLHHLQSMFLTSIICQFILVPVEEVLWGSWSLVCLGFQFGCLLNSIVSLVYFSHDVFSSTHCCDIFFTTWYVLFIDDI